MQINIDPELVDVLNRFAEADNVTPELYVERKINATLASLLKRDIVRKIENKEISDIKTIDVAVSEIDENVKDRDFVEPSVAVIEEVK